MQWTDSLLPADRWTDTCLTSNRSSACLEIRQNGRSCARAVGPDATLPLLARCQRLRNPIIFITRLRLDAALYAPVRRETRTISDDRG